MHWLCALVLAAAAAQADPADSADPAGQYRLANPRAIELFESDPALMRWAAGRFDSDRDGHLSILEADVAAREFKRIADGDRDGRVRPNIAPPATSSSPAGRWPRRRQRSDRLVAATGASLGINSYDEYGNPGASNLGRYGYTGQAWLAGARLWHLNARMYSPAIGGRFMQPDPIGYAGGINLYAYVGNDPVNFVDPLGLGAGQCTVVGTDDKGLPIVRCEHKDDLLPGDITSHKQVGGYDVVGIFIPSANDFIGIGIPGVAATGRIGPTSPAPKKDKEEKSTLDKTKRCASAQLGLDDIAAAGAAVSGFNILGTRGKFGGATSGTSIASRGASAVFGQTRLPFQVPTLVGNPLTGSLAVRGSASVARIVGRGIPVLGWGLLAYDAAKIAQCVASDD